MSGEKVQLLARLGTCLAEAVPPVLGLGSVRDGNVKRWPTDSRVTPSWGCVSSPAAVQLVGHVHL